jgi:hypothetical protein
MFSPPTPFVLPSQLLVLALEILILLLQMPDFSMQLLLLLRLPLSERTLREAVLQLAFLF